MAREFFKRSRRDMNEGSETEVTNELKQKEQRDSKETDKRREGFIFWGRSQRLGAREKVGFIENTAMRHRWGG